MGWGGSDFFLAESQSRLYPHMRAKFGRDPTAVSKKLPFNFISRFVGRTSGGEYGNHLRRKNTIMFQLLVVHAA